MREQTGYRCKSYVNWRILCSWKIQGWRAQKVKISQASESSSAWLLLVLILGTIALKLPISSVDGESISWVDAFFTSTSAVCVTGLVSVVNTAAQWSIFGQCVILALIQIGGLGFMAFTTLIFMIMGRRITLKERLVIQEALNQSTLSGIVKLTRRILIGRFLWRESERSAVFPFYSPVRRRAGNLF
ncbi:MAG: potassium transporter TrkG [Clostridia bacterium]